jgi:4-amino-4-deoxy-L-arabinose transferase-like glycosyltransferase
MTIASTSRRPPALLALSAVAVAAIAAFVLLRLSAYGIWDPWELSVADAARRVGESAADKPDQLTPYLVRAAFDLFGTREWAGRLPSALAGLLLLATMFAWVRGFASTRVSTYALLVLGTTPLFLLHSRQMLGATPMLLCTTLSMLAVSRAVFARDASNSARGAWLSLAALAAVVGTLLSGALLSVAPVLISVALAFALQLGNGVRLTGPQRLAGFACSTAAIVVTGIITQRIFAHAPEYGVWLGGKPLDSQPPTYELAFEQLFHGFAPWSALLPVALGTLLRHTPSPDAHTEDDSVSDETTLKLLVMLWAALAYAAQTLFLSSYGTAAFPAPAALATACALWLDGMGRSRRAFWPEVVVIVLMAALIIRDFALYPQSPIGVLGLTDATVPSEFNPRSAWAILFGCFAAAVVLASSATPDRGSFDLRAPYHFIADIYRRSLPSKLWLFGVGLLALSLLSFGALAWFAPGLPLTTIARKVGRIVGFIPLAVPLVVAGGQLVYHHAARLAHLRTLPVLFAALLCGGYASQVFLPQLSEHFSPRDVFMAYNELAQDGEPLAQYHVEGRAAAYYAKGEVSELTQRPQLIDYLAGDGRRWAALPTDDLPDVDAAFRARTKRHLFVPAAAAENARVTLVATVPVEGKKDHNPLSEAVLTSAPPVQHPVGASFEDRIELVGYNLSLPNGAAHVGAGQSFEVTWVFRVLEANVGGYKLFVHLDGQDQRLNGDHEPVDEKYPLRLWQQGDVIVDRQTLKVPATYPSGEYTLYIGFFRGESRLKVVRGKKDEANRVDAGTIRIR